MKAVLKSEIMQRWSWKASALMLLREAVMCGESGEAPCRTNFNRQAETTREIGDICKELNVSVN